MHFHHLNLNAAGIWATVQMNRDNSPIIYGTALIDNIHIRIFRGRSNHFKPRGQVNSTDLNLAKSILSRLEIVLILEYFDRDLMQLQHKFGWQVKDIRTWAVRIKASFLSQVQLLHMRALKTLNQLDFKFYSFAKKNGSPLKQEFFICILLSPRSTQYFFPYLGTRPSLQALCFQLAEFPQPPEYNSI
jgi:hypothetical protein